MRSATGLLANVSQMVNPFANFGTRPIVQTIKQPFPSYDKVKKDSVYDPMWDFQEGQLYLKESSANYVHERSEAGLPLFDYKQSRNLKDLTRGETDEERYAWRKKHEIIENVVEAKKADDEFLKSWEKNKHKKVNVKKIFDFSPEQRWQEERTRREMKKVEEQGALSPWQSFRYGQNRAPLV